MARTWRRVEDAEERDGRVVVKVRGLFGGDGVTHLTLRDGDVRRSAPHAAGDARVAAMHIRRVRRAWVSAIRCRDRRAERLERREARLMGRDTLKLTLDFAADDPPIDPVKALRVLERLQADKATEFWISDVKHVKERQFELIISNERFGSGVRDGKSVFARRRELVEAILAAAQQEKLTFNIKDVTFSDK